MCLDQPRVQRDRAPDRRLRRPQLIQIGQRVPQVEMGSRIDRIRGDRLAATPRRRLDRPAKRVQRGAAQEQRLGIAGLLRQHRSAAASASPVCPSANSARPRPRRAARFAPADSDAARPRLSTAAAVCPVSSWQQTYTNRSHADDPDHRRALCDTASPPPRSGPPADDRSQSAASQERPTSAHYGERMVKIGLARDRPRRRFGPPPSGITCRLPMRSNRQGSPRQPRLYRRTRHGRSEVTGGTNL